MAGAGPGPHGTRPIPHTVTTVVGDAGTHTNRALVPVRSRGKAQGPKVSSLCGQDHCRPRAVSTIKKLAERKEKMG